MRLHYYQFPKESNEIDRFNEGCPVILKNGDEIYPESIPDEKRYLIDHIGYDLMGISITHAKQLLKKYGGYAYTEHCERDGGVFEITEIKISGNNSRFKYNRHL